MPRVIFKCPYIKSSASNAASHLSNYVRYMATRDGAQKITPIKADQPATKKQQEMVTRLLRDFPLSRGLFEYEDYRSAPTQGNASEFITRALEVYGVPTEAQRSGSGGERSRSGMNELPPQGGSERYGACGDDDQVSKRENYIDYIASRPRAQRTGAHALFTSSDDPLVLSKIADEVAHHPGNVWLPIISLRREDAARLGYDDARQWQALLRSYAPQIAEAMKIPWEQFRWYAAFHDEAHHPHVHMVCYSADGRSGYLTKDGISQIKSGLAQQIFRQELHELYEQQTQRRDELTQDAGAVMDDLVCQMQTGTLDNPRMERLMEHLAERLKNISGKKQYGYLKAPLKSVVDEIVDELAKDPRIAAAYDLWYQLREDVLRTYRDDLPERLPLSRQKEFKRIRNLVIEEAVRLGKQSQNSMLEDTPAAKQEHVAESMDYPQETVAISPQDTRFHSAPMQQSQGASMFQSAARLLHHMGRIFREETAMASTGELNLVDKKLRQKIREKKIAMGHKPDDHEDERIKLQ